MISLSDPGMSCSMKLVVANAREVQAGQAPVVELVRTRFAGFDDQTRRGRTGLWLMKDVCPACSVHAQHRSNGLRVIFSQV